MGISSESNHWVFVVHLLLTVLAKIVVSLGQGVESDTLDWIHTASVTGESMMESGASFFLNNWSSLDSRSLEFFLDSLLNHVLNFISHVNSH